MKASPGVLAMSLLIVTAVAGCATTVLTPQGEAFTGEVWTWDEQENTVTLRRGLRDVRVKVAPAQLIGLQLHQVKTIHGTLAPPRELLTGEGGFTVVPRGPADETQVVGEVATVDPKGMLDVETAEGPVQVWRATNGLGFTPGAAVRVHMRVQPLDVVPIRRGEPAAVLASMLWPSASPRTEPGDYAVVIGRVLAVDPLGGLTVESARGPVAVKVANIDRYKVNDTIEVRTSVHPAPGAGPIAPARTANFAVVRVFYATDRALHAQAPAPVGFTAVRNPTGELTLGTFDVSIPRSHRVGNVERPTIWRLEFRENRDKHFVIVERTVKPSSTFYTELARRVQRSEGKEAMVFVHGFNVDFDEAVYRTAQLSYDLGLAGAPILFSWPSNGTSLDYTPDVNNSEWSVEHLQSFLKTVAANSQAKNVYLVAHSMGNRVLAGALSRLASDPTFTPLPRFTHVVLTAPDIDAGVFRQLAAAVAKTAQRTTLYASSNDKALQLSKRINGYPRAGDAGAGIVVVSGIDTVDVSDVDTDLVGHSYYGDNRSVLSDMFNLLRGQVPPRFGLKEMIMGTLRYWKFVP